MLGFMFPPKRTAAFDDSQWSTDGRYYGGSAKTQAGVRVDEQLALTLGYCWRASQIICQGEATLPLNTYRRGNDDSRELATDSPVYELLKSAPNPTMGAMAFREGRTLHQVNGGNGFAEIVRNRMSRLESLWPIHPLRVRASLLGERTRDTNETIPPGSYCVRNNNGTESVLYTDEMLHIPGAFPEDGIWGKGVVPHARESIGMGIAVERAGATQFGVGNVPRIVVSGGGFRNPAARDEFRKSWKAMHGSPDSGEVAIVPDNTTVTALGLSADQAQWLGSREFNGTVIAGWYGVPPHMIGLLKGSTFASVEAMGMDFVIYSLYPWLRRWEEQCNRKLFTPQEKAEGMYVEHLVAGLLRGDLITRMNSYRIAIMIGVLTINECRRFENLNGIGPAGDKHYVPLNMTTAEDMAAGNVVQQGGGFGSGPGSDQNGAPGDLPPGTVPDQAKAFDGWTRRLARMDWDELKGRIAAIESTLRSDRKAAMLPAPNGRYACGGPGSGVPGPCPGEGDGEDGKDDAEAIPENAHGDKLDESQSEIINAEKENRDNATGRCGDKADELINEVESTDFDEDPEAEQKLKDDVRSFINSEQKESQESVAQATEDILSDVRDNHEPVEDGEDREEFDEAFDKHEEDFRSEMAAGQVEYENELEASHTDMVDYIERAASGEDADTEKAYVESVRDKMDDAAYSLRISMAQASEKFLAAVTGRGSPGQGAGQRSASANTGSKQIAAKLTMQQRIKAAGPKQRRRLIEYCKQRGRPCRRRTTKRLDAGFEKARKEEVHSAARAVLRDTLGRLFAKERNAAERAIASRADFDAWLLHFYGKHEPLMSKALAPACELLGSLGSAVDAPAQAKRLCDDARAQLGHGYNTLTPPQFAALLAGWSTDRAAREADAILEECHAQVNGTAAG